MSRIYMSVKEVQTCYQLEYASDLARMRLVALVTDMPAIVTVEGWVGN